MGSDGPCIGAPWWRAPFPQGAAALAAVLCFLLAGCNVPVVSPPQEAHGGRDVLQTQQIIDHVADVREMVTTMAADLHASAEVTVGQRSGRSSSGQVGLVNIAQQDVTSQMPAAMLAVLSGLLEMKRRRAKKLSWSLTKAIRAAHDECGRQAPALTILRKHLETITRADHTEADNEANVKRLKPRRNGS